MRTSTAVLIYCLSLPGALQAEEIYRFGRLGTRLPAEDVASITVVVADRGKPWAILGWYSQVLPEVRYIDAFLPPTGSTRSLRRGVVAHLNCRPIGDEPICGRWVEAAPQGSYAQVADGAAGFTPDLLPRTLLERPFPIAEGFTDDEILSLVAYIRTAPSPDPSAMGIPGDVPIEEVVREADGIVRVWLGLHDGIGYAARFRHTKRGWRITEVQMGVA